MPRSTHVLASILLLENAVRNSDQIGLYLQRRGPGDALWEFPGGKREPGEGPKQTIVRECREEMGLDIDAFRPELLTVVDEKREENQWLHLWLFYAKAPLSAQSFESNKHEAKWFYFSTNWREQIPRLQTHELNKKWLPPFFAWRFSSALEEKR